MNVFVLLRILIGLLFVASGAEKLIGPYQNFLYVVESYELLPPVWEEVTARTVPWIELFLGVFLVLGFWTRQALLGTMLLVTSFIIVVAQAIVRALPITECGCFGELVSFPLPVILAFDVTLFFTCFFLERKIDSTARFSLDQHFA